MNLDSLILGGLCFGSSLDESESFNFLEGSYNLGIREIDTGSLYGNGMSELIIGNYMKKTNKIFKIHSKVGLEKIIRNDGSFGVKVAELTPSYLVESTEMALKKINQNKLHRLSIHAFCKSVSTLKQIETINYLLTQNIIESYGICNFNIEELTYWIDTCLKNNLPLPKSLDLHFNLFEQKALEDLFPILERNKISAIPYRVFCRGLLADRYEKSDDLPKNSRAKKSWRVKKYVTEEYLACVNYLKIIAKKHNYSLLALVLEWTLSFQCIQKICIGTSSLQQLKEIVDNLIRIHQDPKYIFKKINIENLPADYLKMPEVFFET